MMDQSLRQRPSVLITTYKPTVASRNSLLASKENSPQTGNGINFQENSQEETNCELLTNLFDKTARLKSKHRLSKLDLSQIKGPTGTVRGHRDVVKKSLENIQIASRWAKITPLSDSRWLSLVSGGGASQPPSLSSFVGNHASIRTSQASISNSSASSCNGANSIVNIQLMDEAHKANYLLRLIDDEFGLCVAYTTSLGVIRKSFDESKQMRSILRLNCIKYEERDIYLNQEYKLQLKLRCHHIQVPTIFIDGQAIGGLKELESINESGTLAEQFKRFKVPLNKMNKRKTCPCCGDAKFIACQSCNGSRRSAIHHFKFNSVALRCIKCDRNEGLVACPSCSQVAEQVIDSNQLQLIDERHNDNNNNISNNNNDKNESTA